MSRKNIIKLVLTFLFLLVSINVAQQIYFVENQSGEVQKSDLDGSNYTLLTTSTMGLYGCAVDITNSKIYYTNVVTDEIFRANSDGTSPTILLNSGANGIDGPRGIAVDETNSRIFWAEVGSGKIKSSDFDGTNITDVVTGLTAPVDVSLDLGNNKLYWSDNGVGQKKISRSNLDGTTVEDVITSLDQVGGIEVDAASGKIYWIDFGATDKVVRSNTDGTTIEILDTVTFGSPRGISVDKDNDKVFWSDVVKNNISSANRDGTSVTEILASLNYPIGIGGNPNIALPGAFITVNVEEIDFGSVSIEKEESFNIVITNSGTEVLTIFNSKTTINEFYTNQSTELIINPNETIQLPVYFKPQSITDYHDELTISSNANNEPLIIIQLDGSGVLPVPPTILSIADVPNDQGSQVRIEFRKSRFDQNGDTTTSIASYSVWRLNTDSEWDAIGMFNADRSEKYNYVSPTLGDSTVQGLIWSVFKISAHAVNPDDFYYSESDSGYSIDNIAPTVPQGLHALGFDDRVEIAWNYNKEMDFQYYAIYRSTDTGFNPDTMQTYTYTTIDSVYIDSDVKYGVEYYYKISAFDYAGNQSGYTESVSALVTDIELLEDIIPQEYVLHQNYPNPFNPSTMIKYGIPEQSNIKIEIFNMLGQSVGVLVNTEKSAGFYETTWNATNLTSGIYLISIRAEGVNSKKNFAQVKKALLLK